MHDTATSCASKLKVLADPTRLAVLRILMGEPQHVNEINAILGLEQSLLSHHLKILRQAGLVETTRDGKAVLYRCVAAMGQGDREQGIDLGCCRLSFADSLE